MNERESTEMMMRMIYCIYKYMYYPAHVSKNNTKRSVQSMANKEGGRRTFLAVALLLALAWCGRSDQTVKHLLREMGSRKTTFTYSAEPWQRRRTTAASGTQHEQRGGFAASGHAALRALCSPMLAAPSELGLLYKK